MNKSNALRSDKLRYTPIPKLLFGMSAPAMLSMLVHALYNIVDSIFVSHYNTKALDAIAIAFPLQILIIAFATGIGVGANAVVAKTWAKEIWRRFQRRPNGHAFDIHQRFILY